MSSGRLVFCDPEIKKRALLCTDDPKRFQICSPVACYAVDIVVEPDWFAESSCPCNYRAKQWDSDFEITVTDKCCRCTSGATPCDGSGGINFWTCFPSQEPCTRVPCHVKGPQTQTLPVECSFPELSPGGLTTVPCIVLGQGFEGLNPELCCWKTGEQGLLDPACANWRPEPEQCWRDPTQETFSAANHTYGIAYLTATPPQIFIDVFELPPDEATTIIFGLFAVWQIAEPWHESDFATTLVIPDGSCCGPDCNDRQPQLASCPVGVLHKLPLGYVMTDEEALCCAQAIECCGNPTTNPPTFDPSCNCLGCNNIPQCLTWNCWVSCGPTCGGCICDGAVYPPIGLSRCEKAWRKQFYAFLIRYDRVLPDLTPASIFDVDAYTNATAYILAVKLQYNSDTNSLEIIGVDNNPSSDNPSIPPGPNPQALIDCNRENMVTFGCSLCEDQGLTDCGCNRCNPCTPPNEAGSRDVCCFLRGTQIRGSGLNCGCTNAYWQNFRTKYTLAPDDPAQPGFTPGFFKTEKQAKYRSLGLGPNCDPNCPPILYNCGVPETATVIKASLMIKNPTGF